MKTLKPILFSTPMVQANLDGRKTQTRRTIKQQSGTCMFCGCVADDCRGCIERTGEPCSWTNKEETICSACADLKNTSKAKYQAGDILWVRETWKVGAWDHEDATAAFDYKASPEIKKTEWVDYEDLDRFEKLMESAIAELDKLGIEPIVDEENEKFEWKWEPGQSPFKWKPSIHMPFEAARIFLKVTDVRAERLQDIYHSDARDEGVDFIDGINGRLYYNYLTQNFSEVSSRSSFMTLWESINGKNSWKEDPYVWVYDYERIKKP